MPRAATAPHQEAARGRQHRHNGAQGAKERRAAGGRDNQDAAGSTADENWRGGVRPKRRRAAHSLACVCRVAHTARRWRYLARRGVPSRGGEGEGTATPRVEEGGGGKARTDDEGGSGSGRSCGISLREDVRESETPPPFLSAAEPAETPPPEATKQGTATTLPARGPSNARCRRAAGARPARTPIPNPRVCAGAPFDPGCFSRPRPGAPTGLTHRDRCDEDPPRRGPPATGRGPQRGRFGIPPRHLGRCASCALKLPPRSMRERPPG